MTKKKQLAKAKKVGKYFVKDIADRNFIAETDGFDLTLVGGVAVEVTKEVAEAAKKKYPYLEVEAQ